MTDSLEISNTLGKEGVLNIVSSPGQSSCSDLRAPCESIAKAAQAFAATHGHCLLQNGSFEAGFANWVTLEGTEQISKTDSYIGMAALVLSTVDSGTTQNVAVTPGQIYQLTGYGRSTFAGYSSFGMTFFDAKGRFLARSDGGRIDSLKWCDHYAVAVAPTHAAYVQVWTYQGSDHGLTYIDGLSLRQIKAEDLPARPLNRFALANELQDPTKLTFS
ncbi:MAG: hypothetical protein F6K11_21105 [Leptolyngbya sp. SIO3F4]|nr:hypothetical protein [Leptolyngbya sp. SIO3F4]